MRLADFYTYLSSTYRTHRIVSLLNQRLQENVIMFFKKVCFIHIMWIIHDPMLVTSIGLMSRTSWPCLSEKSGYKSGFIRTLQQVAEWSGLATKRRVDGDPFPTQTTAWIVAAPMPCYKSGACGWACGSTSRDQPLHPARCIIKTYLHPEW